MRRRGFTLLELMVVLVIIGTVMTIAIPRMSDMFEVTLKSAMRKLAGAVQFCFNESVIKQTPLRLNFDPLTGEYWLTYLATQGNTGEFVVAENDVFEHDQLPNGVFFIDIVTPHDIEKRVEGDDIYIGFYPTGFAERGVIHLGSQDGRQYTLLIKPLNGKVIVFEGYVDFADLSPQFDSEQSSTFGSNGF